jgi:hypothetical protein
VSLNGASILQLFSTPYSRAGKKSEDLFRGTLGREYSHWIPGWWFFACDCSMRSCARAKTPLKRNRVGRICDEERRLLCFDQGHRVDPIRARDFPNSPLVVDSHRLRLNRMATAAVSTNAIQNIWPSSIMVLQIPPVPAGEMAAFALDHQTVERGYRWLFHARWAHHGTRDTLVDSTRSRVGPIDQWTQIGRTKIGPKVLELAWGFEKELTSYLTSLLWPLTLSTP